jgi:hypothetical protein
LAIAERNTDHLCSGVPERIVVASGPKIAVTTNFISRVRNRVTGEKADFFLLDASSAFEVKID